MNVLSPEETAARLIWLNRKTAVAWRIDGGALRKTFSFPDFAAAFAFMTRVAAEAERINHHPDWSNVWNRVEVRLNTHDAGAITELDFHLAVAMDSLVQESRRDSPCGTPPANSPS